MKRSSLSDAALRIPSVIAPVISKYPELTVICETYCGLTNASVTALKPFIDRFPAQTTFSWQLYDGPSLCKFKIDADCRPGLKHGCAALRTNNDIFGGEIDDRENIVKALNMSKAAGLDMTYIYGEYPDTWMTTSKNYEAWATNS